MGTLKLAVSQWAREHPLSAFFGVSLLLCHGTLFPAIALGPGENLATQILWYYFGRVGAYSPVLAGIIVVRLLEGGKPAASWSRRISVLLPVWLLALAVNVADLRTTAPPGVPLTGLLVLSIPVALLPAWVISSAVHGPASVQEMLRSLLKVRGSAIWYAVALLTFPVVHVGGSALTNLLNGREVLPGAVRITPLLPIAAVAFSSTLFFSGGINEESGWRGFAQRRLQAMLPPLTAALALWAFLVVWHVPNDIIQYREGGYVAVRWGLYPFITILFTWVYNRAGGSILAAALFHSSMNMMNPLMGVFPFTTAGNLLLIGCAVAVVLLDRMWLRLPAEHPAVRLQVGTAQNGGRQ